MNNVVQLRPEAVLLAIEQSRKNTDNQGHIPPIGGGGEPPMDARITKLETRFEAVLPTLMTKVDGAEIRADIQRGINETQKWMIATVIGLFVGFGGLFLAMSNALKSPPSQQPIIINVPTQAPAAPPVPGK